MPKVSVIVPVYNVEKYIKNCLESLVNQTLKDIEIIIVNDGSTDSSKSIIYEYIEKYNNIVYLEKENGGLSDARNYGLNYAKGEYIAFLDSDDYADISIYEKMYNKAIEENSDYVECDFYWAYPKNSKDNLPSKSKSNTDVKHEGSFSKLKLDNGYIYKNKREMMIYGRVVAWNKLIKRGIITEKFPVSLNYEDVEFFYKLIPNVNKFSFVKEPLIYYIQRENSIVNKQDYRTGQIFNVFNNVFDYYKKNNLYDEYKEELEYSYTRILLCSSLKRMAKIKDRVARERLIDETWQNLNTKFPDWKKNKILSKKSIKNLYIKSVNKITLNIYSKIFKIL